MRKDKSQERISILSKILPHIKPFEDDIDDILTDMRDIDDITVEKFNTIIHIIYRNRSNDKKKYSVNLSGYERGEFDNELSYLQKLFVLTNLPNIDMYVIRGGRIGVNNSNIHDFKSEISNIENRCKSMDIKLDIENNTPPNPPLFSKEIRSIFTLSFKDKIDPKVFIQTYDYQKYIPKNIISDFEKFLNINRIPIGDRENLVNIIKRGDWK